MFAHATGFSWDEALMVMVPIAIVAGVLFLANSRAKQLGDDAGDPADGADGADGRGDVVDGDVGAGGPG